MLKLQFLNSELLQQPKSARKERLSPIFVASEHGLDVSGYANIQTAATKVTNIGDSLSLRVSPACGSSGLKH